ncbi:ABC transporter substrate-binding protein [Shewanella colwelliana]|uniref:ABC transporter substrate-binding protein n=1 Tax=Shewanella colwelliana TaxID=23 RepID=UPI000491D33B|nr:ABC transporter substrate binding protein [Shewanella colwelliana]
MNIVLTALITMLSFTATANSITIVHSYHAEYPWVEAYTKGLTDHFSTATDVTHYYLDTKRLPIETLPQRANETWRAIQSQTPNVIVLADDNAISSLSERLSNTKIPVVFLGLNANPREYGLHNFNNFTGVLERPLFKRNVLMFDGVLPQAHNSKILVMFDNSPTSRAAIRQISATSNTTRLGHIQVDFQQITTFAEWKSSIRQAKRSGYRAIFIGLYHTLRDSKEALVPPNEIMSWTAANAQLPHFGFWDFSVGHNANIGGYVLDGYLHGELAAELINQIAAGRQPDQIHYVSDRKGRFLFSKSGLAKWNLTLSDNLVKKSNYTP